MNTVPFGRTGEQVSALCLGTIPFGNSCGPDDVARIMAAALDLGVTFVDTAPKYADGRSEEYLGRAIRATRPSFFLATKVHEGLDARSITESLEESLRRLQTDHVDLYQIHHPGPGMRPAEMMEALDGAVRRGKARFVGACNFPAWLFAHCNAIAGRHGWAGLACNQVPYSLIERGIEVELLQQAVAEGHAVTVFRPLAVGLLAGRYQTGRPIPAGSRGDEPRFTVWWERYAEGIRRLQEFADRHGLRPSQVAIAWARQARGVSLPIVGVSSAAQLEECARAMTVTLTPEEREELARYFDTAVKEESAGAFVGWRRTYLVAPG